MLRYLGLSNVGPASAMEMSLASRLNIITGDNGLGKSFLLDLMWWALTRRWPQDLNSQMTSGYPAKPTDLKTPATITFAVKSKRKEIRYTSQYSPRDEAWVGRAGRPWNPGLVIYAHADGGFSIWDPARNYWKTRGNIDVQDRLPGFTFSPKDVWDGLEVPVDGKETTVCNGLLRDWASWIKEKGENARLMAEVMSSLAPEGENIEPGRLMRLSTNDVRDIPSIRTKYSDAVPVLHASSGMKRILGLSYMLLWSWSEHSIAAEQLGEEPTSQVIMLFDEIEAHLHPRWQRTILGSLLGITGKLHNKAKIQLVAATHSPLVLASAEPTFDSAIDAWFDLDWNAETREVKLCNRDFVRRGTVGRWLVSPAFDLLSEGRSIPAEDAIRQADELMTRRRNGDPITLAELKKVDNALRATLPDIDRFWIRWSDLVDSLEISPK